MHLLNDRLGEEAVFCLPVSPCRPAGPCRPGLRVPGAGGGAGPLGCSVRFRKVKKTFDHDQSIQKHACLDYFHGKMVMMESVFFVKFLFKFSFQTPIKNFSMNILYVCPLKF